MSAGNQLCKQPTSQTVPQQESSSRMGHVYRSDSDLRGLAGKKSVTFSGRSDKATNDQNMIRGMGEKPATAPLLQYDTLIALLKSRPSNHPASRPPLCQTRVEQFQSEPLATSPQFIKKRLNGNLTPSVAGQPIPTNKITSHMVIDADSISLASLSESPPSEFKFSDEDDDVPEQDDSDRRLLDELASVQAQVLMSKQGAQLVDYSKSIQLQQQRIAQINEQRQRKKMFHNVLLNDTKLNNLKVDYFTVDLCATKRKEKKKPQKIYFYESSN